MEDKQATVDEFFFFLLQLFIRDLVRNLFHEGNDVYREGDWRGSLSHYTEAINIADYANSEEIHVSDDVLEKLHVNRIACFSNMVSCCLNQDFSRTGCKQGMWTQSLVSEKLLMAVWGMMCFKSSLWHVLLKAFYMYNWGILVTNTRINIRESY